MKFFGIHLRAISLEILKLSIPIWIRILIIEDNYLIFQGPMSLPHWGRDKMDAISQTTLSNAFSWLKMLDVRISINISLKYVPRGLINNIPALIQIMAWRRPGDKPLSEPMVVILLTHICVTRPQWVHGEVHRRIYAYNNKALMFKSLWLREDICRLPNLG